MLDFVVLLGNRLPRNLHLFFLNFRLSLLLLASRTTDLLLSYFNGAARFLAFSKLDPSQMIRMEDCKSFFVLRIKVYF